MSNPETTGNEEPCYSNVSGLLRAISTEWNRLENEGHAKLHQEGDVAGYQAAVRTRAQMLADLPEQLTTFASTSGALPPELLRWATDLSGMALQFLEEDSMFAMSTLLRGPGTAYEDPDALEVWADRLEPPAVQ